MYQGFKKEKKIFCARSFSNFFYFFVRTIKCIQLSWHLANRWFKCKTKHIFIKQIKKNHINNNSTGNNFFFLFIPIAFQWHHSNLMHFSMCLNKCAWNSIANNHFFFYFVLHVCLFLLPSFLILIEKWGIKKKKIW